MKKLLSLILSTGLLAAPLSMISAPAAAKTPSQVTTLSHDASVQAKAKNKAKKARAKKSKSASRKK